jgi:hypothetical protein
MPRPEFQSFRPTQNNPINFTNTSISDPMPYPILNAPVTNEVQLNNSPTANNNQPSILPYPNREIMPISSYRVQDELDESSQPPVYSKVVKKSTEETKAFLPNPNF